MAQDLDPNSTHICNRSQKRYLLTSVLFPYIYFPKCNPIRMTLE